LNPGGAASGQDILPNRRSLVNDVGARRLPTNSKRALTVLLRTTPMLAPMRLERARRRVFGAALAAVSLLALAACGGSSEAADTAEVASLATDSESTSDSPEPAADEASADEAALEFSQCLRDEGLDVADIGVDAQGNIDVRSALRDVDPGTEGFREALDACREILEGVGFGGGRGALADNTEIADAMLEFSDCVRSAGFEDVSDLTLGGPGQGAGTPDVDGAPAGDAPPEGGRGSREGGFGDRSTLFAERMGLDPNDPEVVATMDTCMPIVDQAFSDAGVGQPPGN